MEDSSMCPAGGEDELPPYSPPSGGGGSDGGMSQGDRLNQLKRERASHPRLAASTGGGGAMSSRSADPRLMGRTRSETQHLLIRQSVHPSSSQPATITAPLPPPPGASAGQLKMNRMVLPSFVVGGGPPTALHSPPSSPHSVKPHHHHQPHPHHRAAITSHAALLRSSRVNGRGSAAGRTVIKPIASSSTGVAK